MTDRGLPAARLTELLAHAARGPKREGLFALWLVVRAAEDDVLDPPLPPRLRARQLEALRHRLATLTLPAPVRRGVTSALALLDEATPGAGATALHQLTAPTREALGAEAADAVAAAARAVRGARQ
jgi:phytoene/squalene synthetase